jgi:hypothetical protein
MILFLTLVIFVISGSAADIIPVWNCWFHSYNGSRRVVNLVYSYNNTGDEDVPIPISDSNRITPPEFDGKQVDVFKSGMRYYVTLITDQSGVLDVGLSITWTLGSFQEVVTSASIIEGNRCDVKYAGVCPKWVDGFCEDSDYCNGEESCFADMVGESSNHVLGTCDKPNVGVVCSPQEICSNVENRCLPQTPPPPPPPSIFPSFSCWFYTYENNGGRMIMNIKMGYNSTGVGPLVRLITTPDSSPSTIKNMITPTPYNGAQPTLFMVGYKEDSFTIKDEANVLEQEGGMIQWFLTDQMVVIQQVNISPATRCYTTEDDVVVPPTTDDGNSDSDSEQDMEGPQCSVNNTDCTAYNTFCGGTTTCHTDSGNCVQNIQGFDPCVESQSQLPPGTPLIYTCVEHIMDCVQSVNCSIDSQCTDSDLCNGQEFCFNGTCYPQVNFTCGPDQTCVNGTGCVATNQPISSYALVGILSGSAIIFIAVVLVIFIYFWTTGKTKKSKNK